MEIGSPKVMVVRDRGRVIGDCGSGVIRRNVSAATVLVGFTAVFLACLNAVSTGTVNLRKKIGGSLTLFASKVLRYFIHYYVQRTRHD